MKGFRARLTEAAEMALEDIQYQMAYEVRVDPETGAEEKVSRISEATRAKLQMFLVGQHPEAVKKETGVAVNFVIDAGFIDMVGQTARESLPRAPQYLEAVFEPDVKAVLGE
jgi:hypothetical protein